MFGLFKKPQPAARVHIVEPKAPVVNLKRESGGKFRPGMWVVVSERVGILKSMNEFAVCAVMLTDADGGNVLEIQVPAPQLRQATRAELPAKRVEHMTGAQLQRMGYE